MDDWVSAVQDFCYDPNSWLLWEQVQVPHTTNNQRVNYLPIHKVHLVSLTFMLTLEGERRSSPCPSPLIRINPTCEIAPWRTLTSIPILACFLSVWEFFPTAGLIYLHMQHRNSSLWSQMYIFKGIEKVGGKYVKYYSSYLWVLDLWLIFKFSIFFYNGLLFS